MIIHGGISELYIRNTINALGINEDKFFSLPREYQQALIMGEIEREQAEKDKINNYRKKLALKRYEFEEKAKEKVLTLLKKK